MEKDIKFGYIEIQKQKFHHHKESVSIKNIDINKMVVSNRVSFAKNEFRYFTGYKDAENVRPLCVLLTKMSAYRKGFNKTKYMSFFIKDDELLEKYNEIWEKVKTIIKKEFDSFDSEPIYNEKYLKTRIKSYNEKINTNLDNNKIPKESSHFLYIYIKKTVPKLVCKRYQNLSEEEKERKRQYHRDQTKNLSEEEKQKKTEYMRNYYLAHKK